MDKITKFNFSVGAAFLIASVIPASAALITYQPSVDLFAGGNNQNFISTSGTLEAAANLGNGVTPDETLNGVLFQGIAAGGCNRR